MSTQPVKPEIKMVSGPEVSAPASNPLIAAPGINTTGIINTIPKQSKYNLSAPVVDALVANPVKY